MTQKEQRMMKLVSYHLIYIEGGVPPKEKREKLFVDVYNHFNRRNKKRLTKKSDIITYMSELKLEDRLTKCSNAVDKMVKHTRGEFISAAITCGLIYLAGKRKRTKRTED